ncbi:MAG: arginase family protein [Fibrobacter sp.]|nr:arginase family protein [Fibrobacter sp.]
MFFNIAVQDFTSVYKEQSFMQKLKEKSDVFWLDCTQINGTDCYCDDEAQAEINKMLNKLSSEFPGIHFFDNGNYHYMSKLWTDRIRKPFCLVIFDHHPDMQPPRFQGILSCGGWVKEVLDQNEFIQNVLLIGVKDQLIEDLKQDPSAEFEKYQDRVSFITEAQILQDEFPVAAKALAKTACFSTSDLYISIDKDALCTADAATNWDQGSLTYTQLEETLLALFKNHKILGVDICGERAKDCDFSDSGDADSLNNDLNQKLYQSLSHAFQEQ